MVSCKLRAPERAQRSRPGVRHLLRRARHVRDDARAPDAVRRQGDGRLEEQAAEVVALQQRRGVVGAALEEMPCSANNVRM